MQVYFNNELKRDLSS